jgi:hypothetical protein
MYSLQRVNGGIRCCFVIRCHENLCFATSYLAIPAEGTLLPSRYSAQTPALAPLFLYSFFQAAFTETLSSNGRIPSQCIHTHKHRKWG